MCMFFRASSYFYQKNELNEVFLASMVGQFHPDMWGEIGPPIVYYGGSKLPSSGGDIGSQPSF